MTRQETINKAVAWALDTAASPAHGYDQNKRWGPDAYPTGWVRL